MTIIKVLAEKFNIKLTEPFSYFLATLQYLPYILITIQTNDGIKGYGEASIGWDTTGEMQKGCLEIFDKIVKPLILNKKINNLEDVSAILKEVKTYIYGNTALKAGIEAALLDALGKSTKKPVYKLFGGKAKDYIVPQKVFSFENKDICKLQQQVKEAYENGAQYFKFKAGPDIKELCNVFNVLSKINSKYKFIIDVNQGWKNACFALKNIKKIEKFNIAWIEQPIYHEDFTGLADIRKNTKIPIMADESCHTMIDLENLYLRNSIDLINIKLAKCGGIIEAIKMVKFCNEHKIGYMLGDMISSALGTAANLHMAILGNFVSYDITMPERIKSDLFSGLRFSGLKAFIPQGIGLGVRPKS